jgi:aldehyde:ferredoxin oxidoreductase
MFGYAGRILHVDLASGRHWTEDLDEGLARKHLGSRGLGAHVLFRDLAAGTDPSSADNLLIFMTGPMVGTAVPGSGRSAVITKSPATGFYGEAFSGGRFWHTLKYAGYDGLVVRGAAEGPVMLVISDGEVEVADARHLWGKTVLETEHQIQAERGGEYRVAVIGPGGEKGVLYAGVFNDTDRAAARCGVGTVMGQKKLKAVAVRGTQGVKVWDGPRLLALLAEMSRKARTDPLGKAFARAGTSGSVVTLDKMGILPSYNWRQGTFEHAARITGDNLLETVIEKKRACMACTLGCTSVANVPHTPYGRINPAYGGPEYESVSGLGSQLAITDPVAVTMANQLCNAYGIDTISTGSAIAFLMEAFEKGLVAEREIGFPVPWGDAHAVMRLIAMIGRREGIGDFLALGTKRMAERLGPEAAEMAVHVKGLEVAMHEPRGKVGLMLSYAASPRGATHMETLHDTAFMRENAAPDLGLTKPLDRFELSAEKARYIVTSENWRSAVNSLCLCSFLVRDAAAEPNVVEIVGMAAATTGWDVTLPEMMEIGERNWNLARAFSCREGVRRSDDALPPRFTRPLPTGATEGKAIEPAAFNQALDHYYRLRGWTADGVPSAERLRRLGLDEAAAALAGAAG